MGRDGASDTIAGAPDRDLIDELSGYLDVLSSNARLRILRLLATKPMDATAISREIGTSYENTRKHLDRLLSIGLIRKEAGIGRETSKGVHPVWEYSLVTGSLEAIIRTLGVFSNLRITTLDRDLGRQLSSVKGGVSGILLGERPMVILMGGPEDGKGFTLGDGETKIGRRDPGLPGAGDLARDIILGDAYQAVTRISRPHARVRVGEGVFFEDCGSTGGSSVNGMTLAEGEGVRLRNGDVLELGKGSSAARLILAIPPGLDPPNGTERPAGDGATHHARRT